MDVKAKGAKWLSLALCLTAGFSLSACSDDDEGSGNTGGGGVTNAGIQFPVTQIADEDGPATTYYEYSNGRMTGGSYGSVSLGIVTWDHPFSFSYNPLVITEEETEPGFSYLCTMSNIKLNGNGFMTYAEFSSRTSSGDDVERDNGSATWEYDSEGHLISESGNGNDSYGPYSWNWTYTWENGNLTKIEYYDDMGDDAYHFVSTLTYEESLWKNTGVYPGYIFGCFIGNDYLYYSGLLGRTTKLIPTSITDVNGSYTEIYTVKEVNYNPDGSIRRIVVADQNGNTRYETERYGYADYPIQQEQSGYSVAPSKKSSKAFRGMKARRMMSR